MHGLVTGYGGFSGTRLAHGLADLGWNIVAHCRTPRAYDPRLTLMTGDLCQLDALPDGLDLIVHAAATSPALGVTSTRMISDNIEATQRLLQLALHHGARGFLFFSSLSTYGEISDSEVDEATVLRHPDVYGLTKLVCERLLAESSARLPSLSLRLPAVIGGGTARHWVASLVEKAMSGAEIVVFNPEALFNNVVHIDSLISLARRIAGQGLKGAEIVTVGSVEPISISETALSITKAFDSKSQVRIISKKCPSFVVSSRKAIDQFGFEPLTTRDAIARYLDEVQALAFLSSRPHHS